MVSQIYAQSREQKVCTGVTGNEPVAALDSYAVLPLVSHFSRDKEWGCDGFSAVPTRGILSSVSAVHFTVMVLRELLHSFTSEKTEECLFKLFLIPFN